MRGSGGITLQLDGRFSIFTVCHSGADPVGGHSHDSGVDESQEFHTGKRTV